MNWWHFFYGLVTGAVVAAIALCIGFAAGGVVDAMDSDVAPTLEVTATVQAVSPTSTALLTTATTCPTSTPIPPTSTPSW